MRLRKPRTVVVPAWSNFGIGYQLMHGETSLDGPMPGEDVLRAAWAEYRDRVMAMCPAGEMPWAAGFDGDE